MATLFKAQGLATGKSLVEEDKVPLAKGLLDKAAGKIKLPVDHVVAAAFKADAERKTCPVSEVPEGWMGLDIGPATAKAFADEAGKAIVSGRAHGFSRWSRSPGPGIANPTSGQARRSWAAGTAWPRSREWASRARSTRLDGRRGFARVPGWRSAAGRRLQA
jgi:hypothetical protein